MQQPSAIPFLLTFTLLVSCGRNGTGGNTSKTYADAILSKEDTKVRTARVSEGTFDLEIISNGKAYAVNNAEIRFPFPEKISSIFVKNGDRVEMGQTLAGLDSTELCSKLSRAKEAMDKALIDLDDRLIDYGYRLKDSLKVPPEIMRIARTRSGYNNARYNYTDIQVLLEKSRIVAPFSGKVANIEAREFNSSDAFHKLCTLIDDSRMQVEFTVLETEYNFVGKGAPLEVMPFDGGTPMHGIVTQVNPLIDDNGMIRIIGSVLNPSARLLDGMSVKVVVKRAIPDKLYIPKEAIVRRQDREVVFTYAEGTAKWNYVETDLQNSRYVTIRSGLEKGQQVIISNNLNLAHNGKVTLDETAPVVK